MKTTLHRLSKSSLPVLLALTLISVIFVSAGPRATFAQEPPYVEEEVVFQNGAIALAGTLSRPYGPGPHPAVVLMSGSGPQDRDEELFPGFPIFGIIGDYLTRAGLAVLRYDDRGVGESTGEFQSATSRDFASDAKAAVAYLRARPDIDSGQVGVFGHSEGGLLAAILGADPASGVAFIVSMAGPAVSGKEILRLQNELVLRAEGAGEERIALQLRFIEQLFPLVEAGDQEAVRELVYETTFAQWEYLTPEEIEQIELLRLDRERFARAVADDFVQTNSTGWFVEFLSYNPATDWRKVTVPVMALFGGKDVQVDDEQNLAPFAQALTEAGNQDFAMWLFPDANHLFQAARSGAVSEYTMLPGAFTPAFLPAVTAWILGHVDLPD